MSLDSMSVVEQRLGLSLLLSSFLLHAAWDAGCSFFFFFLFTQGEPFVFLDFCWLFTFSFFPICELEATSLVSLFHNHLICSS